MKIVNALTMDFKYGNLVIKCHQCGGVQVIEELVTEGRCLYLFNKADSYVKLHCPDCDITMEMVILPDDEANASDDEVNTDNDEEWRRLQEVVASEKSQGVENELVKNEKFQEVST